MHSKVGTRYKYKMKLFTGLKRKAKKHFRLESPVQGHPGGMIILGYRVPSKG